MANKIIVTIMLQLDARNPAVSIGLILSPQKPLNASLIGRFKLMLDGMQRKGEL
jgi:hypothetical protein